jgi:hypothetical protein
MTITQAICNSFKTEILEAIHNFTASVGDIFKLALYPSTASLDKTTTAYSSTNEVPASGSYVAGGASLVSVSPVLSADTAVVTFNNVSFTSATITARGALIYNSSKANRAVCVLNFGTDQTSTAGTFSITFPTADQNNAILRIA